MFIRYELYVGDERQGCGIFQGMSELNLDDDISDSYTKVFDEFLLVPVDIYSVYHTESWFTEAGEKKFKDAIDKIITLYDDQGLFEVRRIVTDSFNLDDIVYEDENQVLTKI